MAVAMQEAHVLAQAEAAKLVQPKSPRARITGGGIGFLPVAASPSLCSGSGTSAAARPYYTLYIPWAIWLSHCLLAVLSTSTSI